MNFQSAGPLRWLLVAALLCAAPATFAKDKPADVAKGKPGTKEPAGDEKMDKEDEKPAAKSDEKKGAKADTMDDAAPKGKVYRFKSEKKGAVGGAQMMTLIVEDPFTGKTENLAVPNNDHDAKTYDPLTAVADVVKETKPGEILEIETEKVKGRTVVKSVAKANVEPGEELPNGFVFVESDESEKNGMPAITVTLKKFGREVKVGVPFKKDNEYKDATWEPDQKIDYVVRRLQAGTVVEAMIRKGNPPMLTEIYEYKPPERGKFVGIKDVEFNNWPAAGFEIAATDGTAITFTLEGSEVTKNGKTIYSPNPQHYRAVQKIKADTEVEVRYRVDGRTWIMRDVKVLAPPPVAKKTGKTSGKNPAEEKPDDEKMNDKEEKPTAGDAGKDKAGAGKKS